MSDAWKEREKAAEDLFFEKQNAEALNRLQARKTAARMSPVSGKPMEQLTVMGVVVDRCPESGGIWLDAGELEEILNKSKGSEGSSGFLTQLFTSVFKK